MATPCGRDPRLRSQLPVVADRIPVLLCALYVLGGRLRMGRPVCFDRSTDDRVTWSSAVAATSRKAWCLALARSAGGHRGEPRDPGRFADVLATAGDLSDGIAWASDLRHRPAVQKHRGICIGQD